MQNEKGAVTTQRLFFALWPDPALQQQLGKTAAALLAKAGGRPVPPENLHCTLVFLGNVDSRQRACIEDAASRVNGEGFALKFDRLGYFRRPQVAWLGSTTTPRALHELVAGLSHGAEACGFPPEQRPYAVHLTVMRKLRRDPGSLPLLPISWDVDRFALVESVSDNNRTYYRPLRFWSL
jgi:2'-5' RNA ligase